MATNTMPYGGEVPHHYQQQQLPYPQQMYSTAPQNANWNQVHPYQNQGSNIGMQGIHPRPGYAGQRMPPPYPPPVANSAYFPNLNLHPATPMRQSAGPSRHVMESPIFLSMNPSKYTESLNIPLQVAKQEEPCFQVGEVYSGRDVPDSYPSRTMNATDAATTTFPNDPDIENSNATQLFDARAQANLSIPILNQTEPFDTPSVAPSVVAESVHEDLDEDGGDMEEDTFEQPMGEAEVPSPPPQRKANRLRSQGKRKYTEEEPETDEDSDGAITDDSEFEDEDDEPSRKKNTRKPTINEEDDITEASDMQVKIPGKMLPEQFRRNLTRRISGFRLKKFNKLTCKICLDKYSEADSLRVPQNRISMLKYIHRTIRPHVLSHFERNFFRCRDCGEEVRKIRRHFETDHPQEELNYQILDKQLERYSGELVRLIDEIFDPLPTATVTLVDLENNADVGSENSDVPTTSNNPAENPEETSRIFLSLIRKIQKTVVKDMNSIGMCQIGGCKQNPVELTDEKTSDYQNLQAHIIYHSGKGTFQCADCERTFYSAKKPVHKCGGNKNTNLLDLRGQLVPDVKKCFSRYI